MIAVTTTKTGPLFDPDLSGRMILANIRASNEVAPKLAQALKANYSGGIVRRGPGRYGHLADSIRYATQVAGDQVATRVFPAGRAAFKAIFLEKGTRGPHRGGASGLLLPREKRDRPAKARGHAAALKIGPLFRRSAQPHGAPAFRVAERTLTETYPSLQAIFQREIAKEVGATTTP